tara:strand:+ start:70 stop:741 length:672 start_codon:yes stop_codon:yes gene_type:complete
LSNRYSLRNKFGLYFEYRKLKEIIKFLNYEKIDLKDKKILDIGCHRGFQLYPLAFIKGTTKNIYGIDYIPSFIEDAKLINPGINFEQMDVYDLKFSENFFDFVTIIYLYNSIPEQDRMKISSEISKKIKKEGYLLIFDFSDNFLINSIRKVTTTLKKQENKYKPQLNDKILKELYPDFKIIKSKNMINLFSYRLCNFLPYSLVELLDFITPKNYYMALLKKIN